MVGARFGDRPGSRGYFSKWRDPFFEDDGGTFIAAVLIFIILGGLIIYEIAAKLL